ncbi:unnamed protein product [Mytilus coruscus]|uniref:Uncharacterized protein n=1 Tax=Mytilus coruscus TaxID=42192 RepID=A0A6J8CJR8_MYTCO|nr:unnamed protein product [Mytilus coruscus]
MAEGLRYKDNVTIVTGGSSGIGKGCLQVFENQGRAVEEELCKSEPGEAVCADMCNEADVNYALPYLRKTEGNIINMTSMSGQHSEKLAITYAATKGAVSAMTRALAIDEAMYNLLHLSLKQKCDDSSVTDQTPRQFQLRSAYYSTLIDGVKENSSGTETITVLGRMGEPGDVALTCLYLAADSTFCIEEIQVCGGSGLNYANKSTRVVSK